MSEDKIPASEGQRMQLPPVNFLGHINEIAFTAQAYLGGIADPETKQPMIELGMAKRAIDTLEMLQEKTKGNLSAPERNYLENVLYDLRMSYVRAANRPPSPETTEESDDETPSDESPETESVTEAADSPETDEVENTTEASAPDEDKEPS